MTDTWLEAYAAKRPESKDLYAVATQCIAGGVGHDYRHIQPFPLYRRPPPGSPP
jgi:hypothetical protein